MFARTEKAVNVRKLLSDLFVAFGAQGVSFLCSVVATLLVPKALGVQEFAYWQLFVFYASYVSVFQLGLNDGVYLEHGGEKASGIDKGLVYGELRVGLAYQSATAVLIAGYGLLFEPDAGRGAVILSSAVYLLLSNTTFYISFIFQAMNETKIASYATIVNRGAYLIPLIACVMLRVDDFRIYVVFYLVAQALSLGYCLWKWRDFLAVAPVAFAQAARSTFASMKLGIVLTVANVTGMLIMGLARVAIDVMWGLSAFGEVSLSLSIVNFALVFISQAAMVMFPALRAADRSRESSYYQLLRDGLGALLPVAMLLYAPLRALVALWLPQYADSLLYLAFLFPLCLFEVQTNLTVATFLKVRCDPKALLAVNGVALACCVFAQIIAIVVFGTPVACIVASLVGVAMRYVAGTAYLGHVYGTRNPKLLICTLAESIAFAVIAYALPLAWSFVACLLLLLVHFSICAPELHALMAKLRNVRGK